MSRPSRASPSPLSRPQELELGHCGSVFTSTITSPSLRRWALLAVACVREVRHSVIKFKWVLAHHRRHQYRYGYLGRRGSMPSSAGVYPTTNCPVITLAKPIFRPVAPKVSAPHQGAGRFDSSSVLPPNRSTTRMFQMRANIVCVGLFCVTAMLPLDVAKAD